MKRARALARVPKRKRKRPLDIRSMMDWSMLKTMLIPAIFGVFLRQYTGSLQGNLMLISLFLFVNGLILYVPQFFPTSNRDSRTLSRIEGLLMGLGGGLFIFLLVFVLVLAVRRFVSTKDAKTVFACVWMAMLLGLLMGESANLYFPVMTSTLIVFYPILVKLENNA